MIGQELEVLQGDVPDGRDVKQTSKHVRSFRGKNVEQSHAAVQPSERSLTSQKFSGKRQRDTFRGT